MAAHRTIPGTFRKLVNGTSIILYLILFFDVAIILLGAHTFIDELRRRHPVRKMMPGAVRAAVVGSIAGQPAALSRLQETIPLLLDDFEKVSINACGGTTRKFSRYGGACAAEVVSTDQESYLKLVYDISSPSSLAGYLSSLNGRDLSEYGRLTFFVKGERGDEVFKIALGSEDSGGVFINDLFPAGIPIRWQKVSIPLEWFSQAAGRHNMQGDFALVFGNAHGMPYSGTVYLKRIRFEK